MEIGFIIKVAIILIIIIGVGYLLYRLTKVSMAKAKEVMFQYEAMMKARDMGQPRQPYYGSQKRMKVPKKRR